MRSFSEYTIVSRYGCTHTVDKKERQTKTVETSSLDRNNDIHIMTTEPTVTFEKADWVQRM